MAVNVPTPPVESVVWHAQCMTKREREREVANMGSNCVFLCGVMWCGYGQQEAGKELLRATSSLDPDIRTLAWAMLAKGLNEFRKKVLDRPLVRNISVIAV